MMFVVGEVCDPIQETTQLIEDIVRSQVIEIVWLFFFLLLTIHILEEKIITAKDSRYNNYKNNRLFKQQHKQHDVTHDS